MSDQPFTGRYELLDAIEAVIKASDPAKREALASTLDAFAEDCPEDFFWAIGAQSPTLLNSLLWRSTSPFGSRANRKPGSFAWWIASLRESA